MMTSGVSTIRNCRLSRTLVSLLAVSVLVANGCGDDDDGEPRATATPTHAIPATPTLTSTRTSTATPSLTSTTTATATATATLVSIDTPPATASSTPTHTPPNTFTPTGTSVPTPSPSETPTASPTAELGIFGDLGDPLPQASAEQLATFERGRQIASRVFNKEDGLGPDFNVVSCNACHEKPVAGGSAGHYRDFLLVRAVLEDGSSIPVGVNGVQPQFTLGPGGRRPTDPSTNLEATRNPIPFFGVGLLAELPEFEILRHEDPDDADEDGISGRANYDRGFVGRFGRKAQTVSIEGFIRGPLFNHLGLTTDPLTDEMKALLPVPSAPFDDSANLLSPLTEFFVKAAYAQVAAPEEPTVDEDGVPDPELSSQDLFDLVSFAMLLAAPRPDPPTVLSEAGAQRFADLGCAACHIPALEGPRGPVPAYSDLLLHDMGEELADHMEMGLAGGAEFRTQPLWGVAAVAPYLHDGRADTLDDAIRLHGGESAASRDAYADLDQEAQAEVIAFLESLGGANQRSNGLLPPNAPIPQVGVLAGPDRALTAEEVLLFDRGRAVFDRDLPIGGGMGPTFNGDSCRACHFLPVIGGAGPADVDVIRHGRLDNGLFTAPERGTIAPRHSTANARPSIDETANVFETRQTPPLFGLGFLESIPAADILANEDCDNPDPEAVSGCAHILTSGELGRLGWKANVPSLAEFARDAMSNELGITVPDVGDLSFGTLQDADASPDPEITEGDLDALVFFMQRLAPPKRRNQDSEAEAAGEVLFEAVGCSDCHVTDFVSPSGAVPYTDLLLHQVAPDGDVGIVDGGAALLEIRTPPLWGLSLTPPYMHDGRAFTVEEAIARHEGEATRSRLQFEMLTDEDRGNLLAFIESL